ncbi:PLASTID MOVEMENT IMPAIRED1-RELATED2 [Hibiscus trionum]|uniref:PLASTID MOVEMENT IMPAIRED1-RELATED2 n=1 Tax=Hibiscus trionum TaxID=183268 RepID=A0A9W7I5N0_HIBTR|nr:PLASTID MOVEMENT IMPAIRED1-RELATED2 [Hibiscus trionum]
MNFKIEPDEKDGGGDSDNGQLLRDIEEISRALYLHKPSSKASISASEFRSKSVRRTRLSESEKDKKSSSLWDWKKPLKALTRIMRHRFRICFFLHVHSIEGLPAYLNDFNLCVHWKRKDEVLSTRAVRVVDGISEFEETLMCKCFVYGSRSGPHNSAKYENKLFLISVSVVDMSGDDIGQHWIDLTRLLPLSLDDLEGEKGSGKWTTSFNLSGKAKGATLNVGFSFMAMKEKLVESSSNLNASHFVNLTEKGSSAMGEIGVLRAGKGNEMLQHGGTVPSNVNRRSLSVDVKYGAEVLPNLGVELSKSISILYQKFNEESLDGSSGLDKMFEHVEPLKLDSESAKDIDEYENNEFFVIEQGVEMCLKDPTTIEQSGIRTIDGSAIETINLDEILKDCDTDIDKEADPVSNMSCSSRMAEALVDDHIQEKGNIYSKPMTVRELESAFHDKLVTESSVSESPSTLDEFIEPEKFVEAKSHYEASKLTKKLPSLDDLADTVATDFLKMLEIEHDPFSFNSDSALESPRERLLREFENEALASGGFILDFGAAGEEEFNSTIPDPCRGDSYEDFSFPSVMPSKEQKMERLSLKDRRAVKAVEDLDTEALMHEGSLDDKVFQSPPHVRNDGFGSPIMLSPE